MLLQMTKNFTSRRFGSSSVTSFHTKTGYMFKFTHIQCHTLSVQSLTNVLQEVQGLHALKLLNVNHITTSHIGAGKAA